MLFRSKRDRAWFQAQLPKMRAVWDRIVKGRTQGLCDLEPDEPVQVQFKNEIVCLLEEDDGGLRPSTAVPDVSGVC